jgi:hypothetical protein
MSAWGSAIGAGVSVLLGVAGGRAFDDTRSEQEEGVLWTANLIMVPLAWLGGTVAGAVGR